MKKNTKKVVLLLLILGSTFCQSQESPNYPKALFIAQKQLVEGSNSYNPTVAVATYKQLAESGNAQAMNGLGLIYSKGITVPINETEGVKWFEKATNAGYSKAWFNLALLYKEGIGDTKDPIKAITYFEKAARAGYSLAWQRWAEMYKNGEDLPQNYPLAMEIFKQGADNGNTHCLYAQGYLYYKGFGCKQDYSKAIALFEVASQKGNGAAMYMLGLCYRNGYGTTIDIEKAKYWLNKSANKGVKSSERELAESLPENSSPNQTKTISKPITEIITITEAETPEVFQKVKQSLIASNIAGDYTGYLVRYDWSGQNIISKTRLQIELKHDNKELLGKWNEEDGNTAEFMAKIHDDAIVFQDSKIDRTDYFHKTPITYDFKEAKLQLLQTEKSLFIVGNLQLYDSKRHENEKPMYLILEKKQAKTSTIPEVISSVIIHPNPIITDFNLSFDLAQAADVTMSIYYITGRELYSEQWKNLEQGTQTKTLTLNAPSGYYLLNLTYGKDVKTTLLIKK